MLGGPYVSTTEQLPEADHIFIGEAETTLPEFFADLERGEAKAIYRAPDKPPLSLTPIPRFQACRVEPIFVDVNSILARLSVQL